MGLYESAVLSVKNFRNQRQDELDRAAQEARTAHIIALRNALTTDDESPNGKISNLLAITIEIGRYDGYPEIKIPKSVKTVLCAAKQSGILTEDMGVIRFYIDFSGVSGTELEETKADYAAWDAARTFRLKQTTPLAD